MESLSGIANVRKLWLRQICWIKFCTDYLERAGINEFEQIRENLRNLMKYIPKGIHRVYDTRFEDEILSMDWNETELDSDDLKNYRAKAEYYVRQHQDNEVIAEVEGAIFP